MFTLNTVCYHTFTNTSIPSASIFILSLAMSTDIVGTDHTRAVFLVSIICPPIASLFVAGRWYARLKITKYLKWDDCMFYSYSRKSLYIRGRRSKVLTKENQQISQLERW